MKKILTVILSSLIMFIGAYSYANDDDASINLTKADAFDDNNQRVNATPSNISRIEKLYSSEGKLKQVGYNVFNESNAMGGTSGKFGNDYKLSIGESVNVNLYGDSVDIMAISGSSLLSPAIKAEIDSKGNLFVQGLGMVQAENKTLSEVEASLQKLASSKYKNLKVKLNVNAGGQGFSIFVYGAVKRPGKTIVGNNTSIVDALGAAGGVKKIGSLRNITYQSSGKVTKIDLYKTLFTENGDDIIVRPNDKIFIQPIGDVVALVNGVATPGIYEIKQGETLGQIIDYAGGLLLGTKETDVVLTELDKESSQRIATNLSWDQVKTTKLKSGDAFEFKEHYNTVENTVTIQGNIKHPGTYAYKEGMKLSDIFKDENELLEETFITQAVIRRVSGPNNTVEVIPIFLKEFFAGINDPELKPRDIINVYKNTNAEYVDVYGCIDTPKHMVYKPGMTLDDVLTNIQFVEYNIETNETTEKQINNEETTEENTTLKGDVTSNNQKIPASDVAVEITHSNGSSNLYYLYDIIVNGNVTDNISINSNDKVFFRQLRPDETVKSVKVSGFVKLPGTFKFIEGKYLKDMLNMAGGLAYDANLQGIVYTRKNIRGNQISLAKKNNERDIKMLQGKIASMYMATENDMSSKANVLGQLEYEEAKLRSRYNGRIALNIKTNEIDKIDKNDNIEVQDGDEIYIPRQSKHVSVIGEVYNEQSFIYKKGASVKSYIREVGGYTPNANKFRMYKVGANGRAEKVHCWDKVVAGDTIIVPRKIAGNDWFSPLVGAFQSIANLAIMAVAISKW